jgi:hypothetical protein
MELTASDLYPYFRPSECRLRVYLKARGEAEDKASPYEAVILRLGERHETNHLSSLGTVVDLRSGALRERELYGWLFQGITEATPFKLEVLRGDRQLVDIAYDGGTRALEALARVIEARSLEAEPYEPIGWTRCGHCSFHSRCWKQAEERRDLALVVDVDRSLALTLHDQNVNSMDELLHTLDEASLAALKRPWGTKQQKVGARAATILRNAKSLATKSEIALQTPGIPRSANYVRFNCEGLPPQLDELDKIYLWGLQVFGDKPRSYCGATGGFGSDGDR